MQSVMQTTVVDPVCGMAVNTDSDFFTYYKDHLYYFNSYECKERFDENPEEYIKKMQLNPDGVNEPYK